MGGPKGCFPLDQLKTTLYEIFLEKIYNRFICLLFENGITESRNSLKLKKKYVTEDGIFKPKVVFLVSDFTEEKTKEEIEKSPFYSKFNIEFIRHGNLQAKDKNMEDLLYKNEPVTICGGNGMLYEAIQEHLDRLEKEVNWFNIVSIDNINCPFLVDEALLKLKKYDVVNLGVAKRAGESTGVFISVNGNIEIAEYTDIENQKKKIENFQKEFPNNELFSYLNGNKKLLSSICNHYFSLDFI